VEFAEKFNELMKSAGYTAYSLSPKIGISENLLNKYRRGAVMPSGKNLIAILNFFNLTTDYFYNAEQKEKPVTQKDDEQSDLTTFMELVKKLNPEDRELVAAQVEFLIKRQQSFLTNKNYQTCEKYEVWKI
jgi:transcriptional regulator with XRE-family HTH domain